LLIQCRTVWCFVTRCLFVSVYLQYLFHGYSHEETRYHDVWVFNPTLFSGRLQSPLLRGYVRDMRVFHFQCAGISRSSTTSIHGRRS